MSELKEVGYIKKTHGYKGNVRIVIYDDLSFDADEIDAFFLEMGGEKIPHFLDEIMEVHENEFIIHFEEFKSKEEVEKFKGFKIFLPVNKVEVTHHSKNDKHELIGYTVKDVDKGTIGFVKAVIDLPQQEMLVVDYGSKEVLIPLRLELIKEMTPFNKTIIFNLPEGLLEL